MKTQKIKVSEIKPYEANARLNDKTVEKLVDSIERYGYVVPIVVDEKNVVVAGHARLKAITQLGWEDVECLVSKLSEDKNKEFRILDNKIQEISTWNDELLVVELRALDYIVSEFGVGVNTALSESFGFQGKDVEEGDIDKVAGDFDAVFGDRVDKARNRVININCEHCGTKFGVEAEKVGL